MKIYKEVPALSQSFRVVITLITGVFAGAFDARTAQNIFNRLGRDIMGVDAKDIALETQVLGNVMIMDVAINPSRLQRYSASKERQFMSNLGEHLNDVFGEVRVGYVETNPTETQQYVINLETALPLENIIAELERQAENGAITDYEVDLFRAGQ